MVTRLVGFNQQINALRVHDGFDPKYVYWQLRAPDFQQQVSAKIAGTATPIINKTTWSHFLISVPPAAEQTRIAARLGELMPLVEQIGELAT